MKEDINLQDSVFLSKKEKGILKNLRMTLKEVGKEIPSWITNSNSIKVHSNLAEKGFISFKRRSEAAEDYYWYQISLTNKGLGVTFSLLNS